MRRKVSDEIDQEEDAPIHESDHGERVWAVMGVEVLGESLDPGGNFACGDEGATGILHKD
jgi:hypothetical protein